jgi:hypothetical protein
VDLWEFSLVWRCERDHLAQTDVASPGVGFGEFIARMVCRWWDAVSGSKKSIGGVMWL